MSNPDSQSKTYRCTVADYREIRKHFKPPAETQQSQDTTDGKTDKSAEPMTGLSRWPLGWILLVVVAIVMLLMMNAPYPPRASDPPPQTAIAPAHLYLAYLGMLIGLAFIGFGLSRLFSIGDRWQAKHRTAETVWQWDELGIHYSQTGCHHTIHWSGITAWRETPRLFGFYTINHWTVIPKHALSESQRSSLCELLQDRIGPTQEGGTADEG